MEGYAQILTSALLTLITASRHVPTHKEASPAAVTVGTHQAMVEELAQISMSVLLTLITASRHVLTHLEVSPAAV